MSHAQDCAAELLRAANEAEVRSHFECLTTNPDRTQLLNTHHWVINANLHLALGGRLEVPPTPTAPRASGPAGSAQ
jgi:hypothetical protein